MNKRVIRSKVRPVLDTAGRPLTTEQLAHRIISRIGTVNRRMPSVTDQIVKDVGTVIDGMCRDGLVRMVDGGWVA